MKCCGVELCWREWYGFFCAKCGRRWITWVKR